VREPCPTRASAIANDLRKKSQGPERFLPRSAARAARGAIDAFVARFTSWGEHPKRTWRHAVHALGMRALNGIHPDDDALANLPAACSSVEVVHPESVHPEEAGSALRDLFTERAERVRGRFKLNAFIGVPLTFPLMFTPLSNLPMYWFGWRAYEQRMGAARAAEARKVVERNECGRTIEGGGAGLETPVVSAGSSANAVDDRAADDGRLGKWVRADAACVLLGDGTGAGVSETKSGARSAAPESAEEKVVFSCCRAKTDDPANPPPTLLFVPCALLDDPERSRPPSEDLGLGSASFLERKTGIDGLTRLVERYRRALKAK